MIERDEIDRARQELGVKDADVQRDYVFGWLLWGIFSQSELGKTLVLKGGNCLRKGYFPFGRFSGDLDFSTEAEVDTDSLKTELNRICELVRAAAGIEFDTSMTISRPKASGDPELSIVDARVYFQDFYRQKQPVTISVRMDVLEWDRLYLPVQTRRLIHAYSDYSSCQADIRCVKLEEQLASKMKCMLQRWHAADLFDLIYTNLIHPDFAVNRTEIVSTFLRKTIFGRNPGFAKGLFIDLPLTVFQGLWDNIVCPLKSKISFGSAAEAFQTMIGDLFTSVDINKRPGQFFPSSLRNPIMQAAHSLTLLEVVYDGRRRLVEPYSLLFKRRLDGVAREYLDVYDQTGGKRPAGRKLFVADKIASIKNTTEVFEPRFEIELKKAGEVVGSIDFKRRSGSGFGGRQSSRYHYRVACSVCGKRFPRETYNTRLSPHKDKYGNRCIGRIGYMV